MAGLLFRLTELADKDGETFIWGRATWTLPRAEVDAPIEVVTARFDYPGAEAQPTEQVLTWKHGPRTYEVTLDDRHMGAGNAKAERDRFMSMCKRTNRVRIDYGGDSIVGLIVAPVATFVKTYQYRLRFEVSVHFDAATPQAAKSGGVRADDKRSTPDGWVRDFDTSRRSLDAAHADAPTWAFAGTYHETVGVTVGELDAGAGRMTATLSARTDRQTYDAATLRAMADEFRATATLGTELAEVLSEVDSTLGRSWSDPVLDLKWDLWARGAAADARDVTVISLDAERDLLSKADPKVKAIYRPRANESFYAISLKFYGDGMRWREIAQRNRIGTATLTGNEVLIIPAEKAAP